MPPAPRPPKPRAKFQGAKSTGAIRARKIWLILGAALVIAAVLIGISIASGRKSDKKQTSDAAIIAMLSGIPQDGTSLGKASTPVTMIEYIDQQCPFCKQYSDDVLPTIIQQYVRTGKVRLRMIQYPFIGSDSVKAAQYVVAAGSQDKAWQVSELLYANQGQENSGWVSDELLTKIGNAIPGLDVEQWKRDATSKAVTRTVDANLDQGRAAGVSSTPSFFVVQPPNKPEPFEPGSLSPDSFSARLNEALG